MSATSPLSAASESLFRAQELIATVRAGAGASSNAIDEMEAVLSAAQRHLSEASVLFERQSRRINELSAVVVGSNVRHF